MRTLTVGLVFIATTLADLVTTREPKIVPGPGIEITCSALHDKKSLFLYRVRTEKRTSPFSELKTLDTFGIDTSKGFYLEFAKPGASKSQIHPQLLSLKFEPSGRIQITPARFELWQKEFPKLFIGLKGKETQAGSRFIGWRFLNTEYSAHNLKIFFTIFDNSIQIFRETPAGGFQLTGIIQGIPEIEVRPVFESIPYNNPNMV